MDRRVIWAGSTYKDRVVRFTLGKKNAFLVADVAPLPEGISFEYSIERVPRPEDFDKLFDVLISKNAGEKVKRKDYAVIRRAREGTSAGGTHPAPTGPAT